MTFLVGKPGLDGHSNGAEQIAVRARDAGMEVVYEGIRLTPEAIVDAAARKRPCRRAFGPLRHRICRWCGRRRAHEGCRARRSGRGRRHHSAGRRRRAGKAGVAAVYTPKDFELNRIMSDLVRIVERAADAAQ